ncbi:Zn2Cys6 transcriptional regulator [Trichoderma guizhouense]|uniref:Zn2Cys6 transcriptional regulator n=1 Tax=Trichoderma guizhouense TaxID=1491466 RepID=A0A1T3CUT2_9HYPO|nr:Zn2Cys6 transcriptional regulator [Trichoderma guizhouense]
METAVVSLRSPDISARAPSRTKRKWADDGDTASNGTTSAARPRARAKFNEPKVDIRLAGPSRTDAEYAPSSTGFACAATKTQQPGVVAGLSSPGRVLVHDPVAIPQPQPQAYPDAQLHTSTLSGHSSLAKDCYAGTISRQDSDAMSIAYTTEPTAYSHYSTTSATSNPHFQQNHWPVQGQHGDALGQSQNRQVPLSLPPQSVPLQSTQANGAVYRGHPVSPQQPGQLSQDIGANLAAHYPTGPSFPPAFPNHSFVVQYIQYHQPYPPAPPPPPHHYQQCVPHPATGQLPIQAPQGYPYHGPQYNTSLISADTRQLGPPLSTPIVERSQLPENHQQAYPLQQPGRQYPIIPTMDSTMYPGPEAEASEVVHVQDDVSYEHHTHMTEAAEWQNPVDYIIGETHETGEFGDGNSDASGISDTMDIQCDVHDDSEAQDDSLGTETRKIKACTRCRMQKMRCQVDETDPSGDCVGCKTFSKTSKKTIHRMPCYRGKITDAVLFRAGGLELTKRWKGTEMKDVGDRVNPRDVRTVLFTLGICKEEVKIEVVQFRPQSGDVTARFWMDGEQGVRKKKDLAHYCLANIQKTASYFEEYIKRNAVEVMFNEKAGGSDGPGDILESTYAFAIRRFQLLRRKPSLPGKEERELNLLGNLFILWFAMRHSTGSSWIQGKELLGMKPEIRDETYPLFKRVSVPRMILAQFDSINYTRILTKYGKFVLTELESLMSRNQPEYFFLVYVCLFVLLREASSTSADRYRHARNNHGQSLRYSIPQFVESLHDSCNNLLQHWHYYNAKSWPKPNEAADRFNTHLAHIEAAEYNLMMKALTDPAVQQQLDIWRHYKADNGQMKQPAPSNVGGRPYEGRQVFYDWDHPFYWVSQLFEENWQPHATYRAESVDPLAR